jgi:hypothetical protein
MVEYVESHMENPSVQTPTDYEYYVARHGKHSDYHQRTHEELISDVNVLHDFTRKLVKEKIQMQGEMRKAQDQVKWANFKIWALMIVMAAEGSVIGWLVQEFLARFK